MKAEYAQIPPVHPIGKLSMPEPEIIKLDGGATLYIIDGGSQEINELTLLFQGGLVEAPSNSIANILTSVMPEGAAGRTSAEIAEAFDFRGAKFSMQCSDHYTTATLSSLNSMSKGTLPVLHDILTRPDFKEDVLNTIKEYEVKSLEHKLNDEGYVCYLNCTNLIMGLDNPESYIAKPEDIRNVTADDLRQWHKRVISKHGCLAFLSGKLTAEIKRDVVDFLNSLPDSPEPCEIQINPFKAEAPQTLKIEHPDSQQSSVGLGLPAPMRSHPDYLPLRTTLMALGGYFGSRLMKNIREDKGFTYSIQSSLCGSLDGSYIIIISKADAKYVDQLIEEVKVELERMATVPLTDDEFQRVQQQMTIELLKRYDGPQSISSYYSSLFITGMPKDYDERQNQTLHDMTPETICEMAKKYLTPDQLRIVIVGK